MSRFVLPAAAGAGAFILLAGAAAGGYALHQPGRQAVTRTITRTVPKTVYVTRWRTRTDTRIIIAPAAAPSIPCQEISGSIEPGVITPGLPGDTACTVTLLSPMGASHLAQIELTAPDGTTSTWNLANPYG